MGAHSTSSLRLAEVPNCNTWSMSNRLWTSLWRSTRTHKHARLKIVGEKSAADLLSNARHREMTTPQDLEGTIGAAIKRTTTTADHVALNLHTKTDAMVSEEAVAVDITAAEATATTVDLEEAAMVAEVVRHTGHEREYVYD